MQHNFPNGKDTNPLALIDQPHGWWKICVATELTLGNGKEPSGRGLIHCASLRKHPRVRRTQPRLLRQTACALLGCDSINEVSVEYGEEGAHDHFHIHAPFLRFYTPEYDRVMAHLSQLPFLAKPWSCLQGSTAQASQQVG